MKIEVNLQNVYHFKDNQLDFDSYQVEQEYRLIDNKIDIRLGVLTFQNGQFNLNYEAEADLWALYSDASDGIIKTIYNTIATREDEKDKSIIYIDKNLDDILDDINNTTKGLRCYINIDKNKLKKLLTLISQAFVANKVDYDFATQNITETI